MPDNTLTPDCLHRVGGAQLFMSPTWNPDQKGVKVQIIDVFALVLTPLPKKPRICQAIMHETHKGLILWLLDLGISTQDRCQDL
jgi:hypothetical protein